MKKLFLTAFILIGIFASPDTANADVLETVGNGLKKVGTVTVDLFNKGKDKVMSLFSSADPKKIPYLVKKANETQYALQVKQQALLEMYGLNSANGSARTVSDSYLQERANDLAIAWEENEKAVAALKEMMKKCDDKKKDYSTEHSNIAHIEKTQTTLTKNQQTLSQKLAKYMTPSKDSKTSEENPSGLSDESLAQRFDSADNPYTSAGIGRETDSSEEPAAPSYEPGLSSEKPATTSIDPNSPQVKTLINQWLSMKGLDPYGRLLGNGITAAGNADTGGLTRETWLMSQFPELRKYVKDNLGAKGATTTVAATDTSTEEDTGATSEERPQEYTSPSAAVTTSNASSATSASNDSMNALKTDIESGTTSSDEMKARYQQYLEADQHRREVLAQQAATSK